MKIVTHSNGRSTYCDDDGRPMMEGLTFDGARFRHQWQGEVTMMTESEAVEMLTSQGMPHDTAVHLCKCEKIVFRIMHEQKCSPAI